MRNIFNKLFGGMSNLLPLQGMIERSGQQLFLPFYHSVKGEQNLPHIKHLYPVRDEAQFQADLDYLLKHFEPISLPDLIQIIKEDKPIDKNYFHLSFDDGLREVYEIAAPILKERSIPATIFINDAFVDNQDLFFRYKASFIISKMSRMRLKKESMDEMKGLLENIGLTTENGLPDALLEVKYEDKAVLDEVAAVININFEKFLKRQQPYLTTEQLKALQKDGFTIGAHSVDHPMYKVLTLDEQLGQTEKSIKFVTKKFQTDYRVFSFPFTDDGVENTFFEVIESDDIADLTFGCAGLKQENFPFHLQRFPMEAAAYDAERLVTTEYFYYLAKSPFGKNKINRV